MGVVVYQYPQCSTCRKALKWLDARRMKYETSDLVADPIPLSKLKDLHKRSRLPVAKFFNTSGESYRSGDFKNRLSKLTEAEALGHLAKDGKLVKRPIVDTGKSVLVGFDEKAYGAAFR